MGRSFLTADFTRLPPACNGADDSAEEKEKVEPMGRVEAKGKDVLVGDVCFRLTSIPCLCSFLLLSPSGPCDIDKFENAEMRLLDC